MRSTLPARSLRLTVAALIVLGIQSLYATPAQAIAELRARACCAGRCHGDGVTCTAGCCQFEACTRTTAALTSHDTRFVATACALLPPTIAVVGKSLTAGSERPASRRGPIFLLVRSLRL